MPDNHPPACPAYRQPRAPVYGRTYSTGCLRAALFVCEATMTNCFNCHRLTKHGRYCSALDCQRHAERANANDARAKALNPRWKGNASRAVMENGETLDAA